jgi:hypothetical protein
VLALVVVPLCALFPASILLLGARAALLHVTCVLAASLVLLESLFVGFTQMPFACAYLPSPNRRLTWPLMVATLCALAFGFVLLERSALIAVSRTLTLVMALTAAFVVLRVLDARRQRRTRADLAFDAKPELPTLRLGLGEPWGKTDA